MTTKMTTKLTSALQARSTTQAKGARGAGLPTLGSPTSGSSNPVPHPADSELVSRRRFLASAAGLACASLAAFVAPFAARAAFADPAATIVEGSGDAAGSAAADSAGAGAPPSPAASQAGDTAAGSAAGDALDPTSAEGLTFMHTEVPMGETVALNNETDPNSTEDRINHGLDWAGTMEATVHSATLYQGSFNVDEDLQHVDVGYIAQGAPSLDAGEEYDWTAWRLLMVELELHNVDAVTMMQSYRDADDPKQKADFSTMDEDVFKDYNIGSWHLTWPGVPYFGSSVATFNGTKDDPGLSEIYHFQLEQGEARTYTLGFWVRATTDFSNLYLVDAVGGQMPNGNFFKLDVTPANPEAAAGTNLA